MKALMKWTEKHQINDKQFDSNILVIIIRQQRFFGSEYQIVKGSDRNPRSQVKSLLSHNKQLSHNILRIGQHTHSFDFITPIRLIAHSYR